MKTCHKLILAFAFFFWIDHVFAQASTGEKTNLINKQLAEIDQNLQSYKKVSKTNKSKTHLRNEIFIYYNGNEVKKITAAYYSKSRKALSEYYFSNHKLIFSHDVDYKYDQPVNDIKDSGKVGSTTEEKIYFDNGEIIFIAMLPAPFEDPKEFPDNSITEAKRLLNLK